MRSSGSSGSQQLDHLGRLDLDVGPEVDDPSQPRLVLAVPAAGPPQRVHERDGRRVGADEGAGQRAGMLQHCMLGAGAGGLAAAPVKMQLVLDLARLGVGPLAAGGDHDSRRLRARTPGSACAIVGAWSASTRQHQAVAEIALARAGADEGRDRRSEHGRPCRDWRPLSPGALAWSTSGSRPAPLSGTRTDPSTSFEPSAKVRRTAAVPSSAYRKVASTKRASSARSASRRGFAVTAAAPRTAAGRP